MKRQIIFGALLTLFFLPTFVFANWDPPNSAPPGCNPAVDPGCSAPVNTSTANQWKGTSTGGGGLGIWGILSVASEIRSFGNVFLASLSGSRVGIGVDYATEQPGATLDVRGDIKATSDICTTVLGVGNTKCLSTVTGDPSGLPGGTTNQTLRHDGTSWVASSVILNDGTNVGIGATPPFSSRLRVVGDGINPAVDASGLGSYGLKGHSTSQYGVFGDSNTNAGVYGESSSVNQAGVFGTNDNGGFGVWGVSSGVGVGVYGLTESGTAVEARTGLGFGYGFRQVGAFSRNRFETRLGIGRDPSSSNMLEVQGNIHAFGGDICTDTTCLNSVSDARLKTDVKTVPNALEKVLGLRGVNFEWKDKRVSGEQLGFIAQEVEKVVPEVITQDSDGYYGVQYGQLTALLVEAIKEQQKEIESLKAEVATLKK